jgi:hypothetical protein
MLGVCFLFTMVGLQRGYFLMAQCVALECSEVTDSTKEIFAAVRDGSCPSLVMFAHSITRTKVTASHNESRIANHSRHIDVLVKNPRGMFVKKS